MYITIHPTTLPPVCFRGVCCVGRYVGVVWGACVGVSGEWVFQISGKSIKKSPSYYMYNNIIFLLEGLSRPPIGCQEQRRITWHMDHQPTNQTSQFYHVIYFQDKVTKNRNWTVTWLTNQYISKSGSRLFLVVVWSLNNWHPCTSLLQVARRSQ